MIFQDPVASLNPRMTVAQIIGEPLLVNGIAKGAELDDRVAELMQQVGLEPAWRERYPHAFSGGQRQRIGIARAIALEPAPHRRRRGDLGARRLAARADARPAAATCRTSSASSYIFISHDIGVIRYMCDRVAVMYRGQVVETGDDRPGLRRARSTPIPRRCSRRSRSPIRAQRGMHKRFRYAAPDILSMEVCSDENHRHPHLSDACRRARAREAWASDQRFGAQQLSKQSRRHAQLAVRQGLYRRGHRRHRRMLRLAARHRDRGPGSRAHS